jgi:hypothetical protein
MPVTNATFWAAGAAGGSALMIDTDSESTGLILTKKKTFY